VETFSYDDPSCWKHQWMVNTKFNFSKKKKKKKLQFMYLHYAEFFRKQLPHKAGDTCM